MRTADKVRLGFCPIGRFLFSHEDALRQKALIERRLRKRDLSFVGIDGVVADGIIRYQEDVEVAVEHFRACGVDAVFMPHCDSGTEGAVGMIG